MLQYESSLFESEYIKLRNAEGRLYSDEMVAKLPFVTKEHVHYKEWKIRRDSLRRLILFLQKNENIKRILEIGCGNGWLCNQLHKSGYEVAGYDINQIELNQAKRLFPDIEFFSQELLNSHSVKKYDVVLFAASLQYFKNALEVILFSMKQFLNDKGYIIIADTFLYSENEDQKAKERSLEYFKRNNSEMGQFYFHHSTTMLNLFDVAELKPQQSLLDLITGFKNPFKIYIIKAKS
jgi:SAM-dependent methyltransferase